jgi:aryl-alcohol dehydrogenase-like predicted oxidoreductase
VDVVADDDESVATIRRAIDAGVSLLDTVDFYGSGHNELLIGRAMHDLDRDSAQLSVKSRRLAASSPDAPRLITAPVRLSVVGGRVARVVRG